MFNFKRLTFRFQVYTNRNPDPGDSYSYLNTIQKQLKEKIRYFVLCRRRDKFDKNVSIRNKSFQKLIKDIDKKNTVGIHPSFTSNQSFDILCKEYRQLEKTLDHKIEISRQHYLKLSLPDTYRNLLRLGIKEDYSMGYSTHTGFRAGIARPFYFYDLYEEKQTSLRVVPFHIMDRTLLSYLNYSTEQAIKEFEYYSKSIKNIGGLFVSLWHNTSLNDFEEWQGWQKVFKRMIEINSYNDQVS
ncbi:hypothetical protein ES708_21888 [subsurface metagenome]